MDNSVLISLKHSEWKVSFQPLPFLRTLTMGGSSSDICIPDCPDHIQIECIRENDGFCFKAHDCLIKESSNGVVKISERQSVHFHITDDSGGALFSIHAAEITLSPAPEYDRIIDVPDGKPILIGGNSQFDIVIQHPLINSAVVQLSRSGDKWIVRPEYSVQMGVFLNTKKIAEQTNAAEGDFLFCPGLQLYLGNGVLKMPSEDGSFVRTLHYIDGGEQNSHLTYPVINRTSRRTLQKPNDAIQILDPSNAPEEKKRDIWISLLPVAAMVLLTVLLRGSFSSNISMVLFSTVTMAIGGVTSVITYFQTGKETKEKAKKRKESYEHYIADCEQTIIEKRTEESQILHSIYISPETEIQNVREFSAELFDRNATDDDFLDILLGYGTLRSGQQVSYRQHEVFEATDELFSLPQQLHDKYEFMENTPSYVRSRTVNAIGIVGDDIRLREIVRNISLDLVTRQYFDDINLYYFLPDGFQNEKNALRMLPHVRNTSIDRKNISDDEESNATLLETLFKQLCDREAMGTAIQHANWLVVFIYADDSQIMRHPLMEFIEKASALHTVFIFLTKHKDLLPQGCTSIIRLANNVPMGVLSSLVSDVPDQLFSFKAIDNKELNEVALRLAPVYSSEITLASHLSTNETLFNMLDIRNENEIDIIKNWKEADTTKSIAAPLGILNNGNVLSLDLHETVHGPHGLVAGTTGSGKSQVLISYILSLATRYSPEDVAFAVIDFKGGDIVKQLPGLPHIVGSITNLSKDEINRSLQSINAEKNKRMMLFDEDHANVSNITEYTRAYKAGKINVPLPHLFIIVDEFAELKSQFPDSMQDLISIARVGRSLGIHMILCTQKPSGVVDGQIWSNSDFQLCLRVQTREDSNEVLKSPLAAEIHEPGRGYLSVGRTSTFDLFQSGYSGASSDLTALDADYCISQVDVSGRKTVLLDHKHTSGAKEISQREAILDRIIEAFEQSGLSRPEPLCQPPLPDLLPFEMQTTGNEYSIPVGIYDDPDSQALRTLTVDVEGRNTLIVGNSQMGKTNMLLSMVRHIASVMTSGQIQVYAIDYNAKALKSMEKLDIVGGVVVEGEQDKLTSLFRILRQAVEERKALLMSAGVTTFHAYRELNKESGIPVILVILDNYAIFKEMYEENMGSMLSFLLREGPSLGISFVVTTQQLSIINYRIAYLFTQRFAMALNDRSDYSSILENCRRGLKDIPGRVLTSIDKKIFEGQIYEAFSGKTEAQRIEHIQSFVAEHTGGTSEVAKRIPEIPELLTYDYIASTFHQMNPDELPLGMDYDDIIPICLNLVHSFSLSLIGGNDNEQLRFTSLFANFSAAMSDCRVHVFDRYDKPLRTMLHEVPNLHYTSDSGELKDFFENLMPELDKQLQTASQADSGQPEGTLHVIILNGMDVLRYLSGQASLVSSFQRIAEDYRRMKVFFLFADVANKPIRYSSPEMLKFIGEEKKALLFGELSNIKAFDIPLSVSREFSGQAGLDDAFLMDDDDISRIKVLRS